MVWNIKDVPTSLSGTLTDFTYGDLYKSWFREGSVFENMKEVHCVPLSLFADGVNPKKTPVCSEVYVACYVDLDTLAKKYSTGSRSNAVSGNNS